MEGSFFEYCGVWSLQVSGILRRQNVMKKVPGGAFSTSPAARHLPTFARAGKGYHSVFVCSVSSSQDLQFAVQAELSPGPHRLTAQRFLAAAFEGVVTSCYKRLKNSLHLQHTWPALPFKHASLLLKNAEWPKDKQGKLRPVYSWDFFSILCNKKKLDFHKELLATSYCDMTFSGIVYFILNLLQTTWYMWIYVEWMEWNTLTIQLTARSNHKNKASCEFPHTSPTPTWWEKSWQSPQIHHSWQQF